MATTKKTIQQLRVKIKKYHPTYALPILEQLKKSGHKGITLQVVYNVFSGVQVVEAKKKLVLLAAIEVVLQAKQEEELMAKHIENL